MFGLFSKKAPKVEKSKTGVYLVNGKNVTPLNELPGNGSIDAITQSLGFDTKHQAYVVFVGSSRINCIAFRMDCRKPIFVLVSKDEAQPLRYSDVSEELRRIDWKHELDLFDLQRGL